MTEIPSIVLPPEQRPGARGLKAPSDRQQCPACGHRAFEVFFQQHDIPVTSNVSFRTAAEALTCPRGDLRLAFCHGCGMIANVAYEAQPPRDEIETSQAASPNFRSYARSLARAWIDRYGLQGEVVLEIGCARGEFLEMLVEEGVGHAVGVDPVLAGDDAPRSTDRVTYVGDIFRPEYLDTSEGPVRAIVCRHTLEHIYETGAFLAMLREAIGDRDIVVLFEVPDAERILVEVAFHDIYYEHCTYFSAGSLDRLFRHSGFEVLRLDRTYSAQYLVIEARPGVSGEKSLPTEDDRWRLWRGTQQLQAGYARRVDEMERLLRAASDRGERLAFWGAGSKATAFLTSLPATECVQCVVDINPRKWGTFIAGTGQPVVPPEHLVELRPDLIVLMNPAYRTEVAQMLDDLCVSTRLIGPDRNE